ncbi:L,D-transpeptidase family protein [Coraliomargarita parva]|uniref:L,D-transpeptidase family protein n=1 Tax=Coraliomargarita parva TaxID=3014050 RepID=UPI0022B2FD87|nr:L,D-transpeptidase [Coraliomargarita parva]
MTALLLLGLLGVGLYLYRGQLFHHAPIQGRIADNAAEIQIALARSGYSPGSIDGQLGKQTRQALQAFQRESGLEPSGEYDASTASRLKIEDPVFARLKLSAADFKRIETKPASWRERGQRQRMAYNSILEQVAEFTQSDPDFLKELNPGIDWLLLELGDEVTVPHMPPYQCPRPATQIEISLSKRSLQLRDDRGKLLFHCPVSIARRVDKRPQGELKVIVRVEDPNYTFNPSILTATAQREGITEKFIIQPGPNNPVGSVWIGLNLPSYGIHGTPEPEKVGRTESSGCFRLANWNAETVLQAVAVGTPVLVRP